MKLAKFAVPLLFAVALAVPAAAATSVVKVKLWDKGGQLDLSKSMGMGMGMKADMTKAPMGVDVDKKTVKAGKVTFDATNTSKEMVHELIITPAKTVDETLPYLNNENRIDEEHGAHLGEVSELEPGKSGSLTITMKPGFYVLYCNIPGHYMAGMWTTFTVTK